MKNLKSFFLILLFCLSNKICAQEIEWQNTIGGTDDDYLTSIIATSDGGSLITGYSNSGVSGDKTETSNGNLDYWVVKLDRSGNIQWQNTIGGNYVEWLNKVVTTGDGGYLLVGWSASNISGDKTENCWGNEDFWIVKIDSSGAVQWDKTIGGTGNDVPKDIINTSDGGYLLGGYSNSGISGNKTIAGYGYHDYWIVKIDSMGNILWQKCYGGDKDDLLYAVKQTPDGGFILGGYSRSENTGIKTEPCQGLSDYWIIKTDSLGVLQWQNAIGGSSYDYLTDISPTNDNGYIVCGWSQSGVSGDKTEITTGGSCFWIIKLDFTGNIQWQNSIGGSGGAEPNFIFQNDNGGYLTGGNVGSAIAFDITEASYSTSDYILMKLDSAGNIIWQNTIGGDKADQLYAGCLSIDGNYLLAGRSKSDAFADKNENCIGGWDYWILKLTGDTNYNQIEGVVYVDINNNNLVEPTEPLLPYLKVAETNTNRYAFSNYQGEYSIVVLDTGSFVAVSAPVNNFFSVSPAFHTANFNLFMQVDSLNDFANQASTLINDLCIGIQPTGPFRSGFNAGYIITYDNQGTTSQSPQIVFYPDSNLTFVAASINPDFISPDSVGFTVPMISPFQSGQILITVAVQQSLSLGTPIISKASIFPIIGDVDPACNHSSWEVLTTGSYDPNQILVNRDTIFDYEVSSGTWLEYVIYFQNVGNDTAFNVIVLNPIDTLSLQLNTLEIQSISHNCNIRWIPWQKNLEFKFDNILLPDSNVNEPLSHGFIRYKIKPETNLQAGDLIANRAYIYFDFNSPVATNIANTDIILFTGIHETSISPDVFQVYPNPASSLLNIQLNQKLQKNNSLELYSVFGQRIQTIESRNSQGENFIKTIDISHLYAGVYFIKLEGNSSFVMKFVKY